MEGCPIRESPEMLRPRERLLQGGAEALSADELLALILGSGRVGEDVVTLARRLIHQAGGLQALSLWTPQQLCDVPGIGPAKAASVLAGLELARRLTAERSEFRRRVTSASDLSDLLVSTLGHRPREVFAAAWLDAAGRLIGLDELFEGGINYASVSPRVVVERALARRAVSVVIAHNHPSGSNRPSTEDIHLTDRLRKSLDLVEVRLLDHLLVTQTGVTSVR